MLHLSGWERFDAFGRFFWQNTKNKVNCETLKTLHHGFVGTYTAGKIP